MKADQHTKRYLEDVVNRLREILGDQIIGVYMQGSYSLSDYIPGKSDLDMIAVVPGAFSEKSKDKIVKRLSHDVFPYKKL